MKKALVIGASSGIGKEMVREFASRGYTVGMSARRVELLEELRAELAAESCIKGMDIGRPREAAAALEELLAEMGGADVIVVNAATGVDNSLLDWDTEENILQVNVIGFAAMACAAYRHLAENGGGALVGISSFACLRGAPDTQAYSASKAFVSNYLEGLRIKALKEGKNIRVVDIRPGFVDTPMTEGQKGMFWVAPARKAARQIVDAAERGSPIAYITRRWRILAHIVRNLPLFIYRRV